MSSEDECVQLSDRAARVSAEVLAERRGYDVLVNRLNKRLTDATSLKNKAQLELSELTSSVELMLENIAKIESDPHSFSRTPYTVSPGGIRGPPLPSQDQIFQKARGSIPANQWRGSNNGRQFQSKW